MDECECFVSNPAVYPCFDDRGDTYSFRDNQVRGWKAREPLDVKGEMDRDEKDPNRGF